nr:hypothetical protein [Pseudomonas sp. BIGb0427]
MPPYGNGSGRRVVEGSCKLDAAEQTVAAVYQRLDRASPRNLNAARKFDQLPRSNGLISSSPTSAAIASAVCAGARWQPVPLAAQGRRMGRSAAAQHPDRSLQPAKLGLGREPARAGQPATSAAGL